MKYRRRKRDGSAMGGHHYLNGHVRPTLELIVTETPARLKHKTDPETGVALLNIKEEAGWVLLDRHAGRLPKGYIAATGRRRSRTR